jgi:hypothetical protein
MGEDAILSSNWFSRIFHGISRGKLIQHIAIFAVFFLVVCAALLSAAGLVDHTWVLPGNSTGIFEDKPTVGHLLLMLTSYSAYCAYTMYVSRVVKRLHDKGSTEMRALIENKVIPILSAERLEYRFLKYLLLLVGFFVVVLSSYLAMEPMQTYGRDLWFSGHYRVGFWVGVVAALFEFCVLLPMIGYFIIATFISIGYLANEIADGRAQIYSPLDADRAAGLSPLGKIMIFSMYFILPVYLLLLLQFLAHNATNVMFVVTILSAVFINIAALSVPFLRLHKFMRRKKDELLDQYSERLAQLSRLTLGSEKQHGELASVLSVCSRLRTLHTWPYNISAALSAPPPLVVFVVSTILAWH